ncbi:MAG: hypothetical protein ACRDD7_15555, partial [Peptostreptococcaceae bacterium]
MGKIYKLRVARHKVYMKLYNFIIKHLALHMAKISNLHNRSEEYLNRDLEITYYPKRYDRYEYCKHSQKQWCGMADYKYVGRLGEYRYCGKTIGSMYLDMIRVILLDGAVQYPFCTYKLIPKKLNITYRVLKIEDDGKQVLHKA